MASSSSSSPSSSLARLNNIANHISPAMSTVSNFSADTVPQAPEDPLFGLLKAYKADQDPKKVDLVSDPLFLCPVAKSASKPRPSHGMYFEAQFVSK